MRGKLGHKFGGNVCNRLVQLGLPLGGIVENGCRGAQLESVAHSLVENSLGADAERRLRQTRLDLRIVGVRPLDGRRKSLRQSLKRSRKKKINTVAN